MVASGSSLVAKEKRRSVKRNLREGNPREWLFPKRRPSWTLTTECLAIVAFSLAERHVFALWT